MAKAISIFLAMAFALMAVLSAASAQKPDSFETNNEIGDASDVTLSKAISSSIFPAQDVDFYKVYVDSPGILQARISDMPKEMSSRIDLYGKNYNWITRKDAQAPGENVLLSVDIGKAGWYYFGVSDLNGGSYTAEYSFLVSFEPLIDDEPNSEIGDSIEIQAAQIVKGYVFPAQDADFYKIFLNSSGILQASLVDVPKSIAASMKGRIDFYGKNYNWITRNDAENSGDNVTLKIDIGNPGWYYIGISDLNGGSYNRTFKFLVYFKPVVDEEPNSEIGDATDIQLGNEVKGFIFPAADVDFYKIYLETPGALHASLESVPQSTKASMKGRIDFYGKNFNWINRKDAEKAGDSVVFKQDIANPGWYYFGISDLNGGSYDMQYTFKVTQ
jgi:hypothetical protein